MQKFVDPLESLYPSLSTVAYDNEETALLIIDMQYMDAHKDYGLVKKAEKNNVDTTYYVQKLNSIINNQKSLIEKCRENEIQIIYCVIESLTKSGKDRSLEHKNLQLLATKNSFEAKILEELTPQDDDIIVKKTCSGAFNGTNLNQLLRNMGIKHIITTGVVTNQCVDTTVRCAADLGYYVTLVEDACAAFSPEIHNATIEILKNVYCESQNTMDVCKKIAFKKES